MQIERNTATVLIVPGLRDEAPDHWQTHLEGRLRAAGHKVHTVPPIGKANNSCEQRVEGLAKAVSELVGPIVLVAHSGACITVAHWAQGSADCHRIRRAFLAVPPDFENPLPPGYPSIAVLDANGWFPVPRTRLPFESVVISSTNDPLASLESVTTLASQWGSELINVGAVGHLNPASGFGHWPLIEDLLADVL